MSWFSDLFGGSKGGYETKDLLDPTQRALFNKVGSYYSNALSSGGFPQYTGDYTAPMNEAETKAISNQGDLANMYAGWRNMFQPGQLNPEVEKTEYGNLQNQFYGSGNEPGAKALAEEQFAGTGGYWGDARAKGVMNTYADTVSDPYNTGRSTRLQNSYTNALNYGTTGTAINQANQTMQAVPRLIQQYGLDQAYKEFIRTRPESSENMSNALKFLDITSQYQQYNQGSNSKWGALGTGVGTILGTVFGGPAGGAAAGSVLGGIGGLFDNNTTVNTPATITRNSAGMPTAGSGYDSATIQSLIKALQNANISSGNLNNSRVVI